MLYSSLFTCVLALVPTIVSAQLSDDEEVDAWDIGPYSCKANFSRDGGKYVEGGDNTKIIGAAIKHNIIFVNRDVNPERDAFIDAFYACHELTGAQLIAAFLGLRDDPSITVE